MISTLTYLALIFTFAIIDWWLIEVKEIDPNKKITWPIRLFVSTAFALIIYDFEVMYALRYLAFLACLFYALFDYTLNVLRGKPFFHKGQNWIDKVIPAGRIDLSVKILLLIISFVVWQYDFFFCLRTGFLEPGFLNEVRHCIEATKFQN